MVSSIRRTSPGISLLLPLGLLCFGTVVSFRPYGYTPPSLDGFLNVYKPRGCTSSDVVLKIKRIIRNDLNLKVKVGHGGTLDSFSEGVLAIGIGMGTKRLEYFLKGDKEYFCKSRLGYETDTNDPLGKVVYTAPWEHITDEMLNQVVNSMQGIQEQLSPTFCAKRINGEPLYKRALKKMETPQITSTIHIYSITRKMITEKLPDFAIYTKCSAGTYLRSVVRDIGIKLNSRATSTVLIRTKKCHFDIKDSLPLSDLTGDYIAKHLIPLSEVPERKKIT